MSGTAEIDVVVLPASAGVPTRIAACLPGREPIVAPAYDATILPSRYGAVLCFNELEICALSDEQAETLTAVIYATRKDVFA